MGCRVDGSERKVCPKVKLAPSSYRDPGMVVGPSSGKRAGSGMIAEKNEFIATRVGWLHEQNNVVSVSPINSAYMPRSGDLIVGFVAEVRNNLWFFDVNGPFQALLPMSLAPWKVELVQHESISESEMQPLHAFRKSTRRTTWF